MSRGACISRRHGLANPAVDAETTSIMSTAHLSSLAATVTYSIKVRIASSISAHYHSLRHNIHNPLQHRSRYIVNIDQNLVIISVSRDRQPQSRRSSFFITCVDRGPSCSSLVAIVRKAQYGHLICTMYSDSSTNADSTA